MLVPSKAQSQGEEYLTTSARIEGPGRTTGVLIKIWMNCSNVLSAMGKLKMQLFVQAVQSSRAEAASVNG